MLDLVFRNLTPDKKYNSKFFEKVLNTGFKGFKFGDKNIELSLNLVGEDKIKELNKKYRKKNEVTDVLSFPLEEKLGQGEILPLGDIFICLSFAKKQAKSENISIDTRLARLTVHGLLHLLGYDHERSDNESKRMFSLEDDILKKWQGSI